MKLLKPGWVKRILPLSVALGIIAGVLIEAGYLFQYGSLTEAGLSWQLYNAGCDLGFLAFPAIVSYITSRFYFLWGIVPGLTAMIVVRMLDFLEPWTMLYLIGRRTIAMFVFFPDWHEIWGYFALGVVTFSGPVSLIRYIIQRRQRKPDPPVDEAETAFEEGAWPPAPKSSQSK
jgi:hypothetical protein